MKLFNRFFKESEGQDLIEYALLASILAVGAVIILGTTSTAINGVFTTVVDKLTP